MKKNIYIIGAGLSGLAAGVKLLSSKHASKYDVTIIEAGIRAGGRCYSFYDKKLGAKISNGSHLILSSNKSLLKFIDLIKANDLIGFARTAAYAFNDIEKDEYWAIYPNKGIIPLWPLFKERRIPDTTFSMYMKDFCKIFFTSRNKTVFDILGSSPLYKRLWEIVCVSILNTKPEEAHMPLFRSVILKTLLKGSEHLKPIITKKDLDEVLIQPAIDFINTNGGKFLFNSPVSKVKFNNKTANEIKFKKGEKISLTNKDSIIMCVPPRQAKILLNQENLPLKCNQITTIHYKTGQNFHLPEGLLFIGAINAKADWIFKKDSIISATISHSNDLTQGKSSKEIAEGIWSEVSKIAKKPDIPIPEYRIINDKFATISHTLENEKLRKKNKTKIKNLLLAGDWIDTDLPSTMEGAVHSGFLAADIIINQEFSFF